MRQLILASASPRRAELIKLLGYPFEIITEEVEEVLDEALSPEENVQALARLKAQVVAKQYQEAVVIGADTMVCLENNILGKPYTKEKAKEMLRLLSGKRHKVITGVAIYCEASQMVKSFCETTYVQMKALTEEEIDDYVASKEPLDKAGAYGIQGRGALFIEGIQGDYYNVVGLPVHQIYKHLTL